SLPPPPHAASLGAGPPCPPLFSPPFSLPVDGIAMTAPTIRGQPASTRATPGGPQAQAPRQAFRRRKARAKARNETRRKNEAAQVEAMPVLRPHACGIDVGSRSHWACVGFAAAADTGLVREFPAHTPGLKDLAAFLREHQVQTVAMESTGIY